MKNLDMKNLDKFRYIPRHQRMRTQGRRLASFSSSSSLFSCGAFQASTSAQSAYSTPAAAKKVGSVQQQQQQKAIVPKTLSILKKKKPVAKKAATTCPTRRSGRRRRRRRIAKPGTTRRPSGARSWNSTIGLTTGRGRGQATS